MTSLLATESLTVVEEINSLLTTAPEIQQYRNRQRRHVLNFKKTNKQKCNKVLKRKLKKYKLRQDGQEDQDVIDVSKILISALFIKSPSKPKEPIGSQSDFSDFEDLRPKNYLFKMVRRKAIKISESLKHSNTKVQDAVTIESPSAITSQEKKKTNAFKMLMDSRNKSIGSNSPGKEKSNDNSEIEEVVERKNLKVKRHLVLQKMAEAKGSLRNKEIEEYQDNIIKKQMEKRAQKLKCMLLKDTKSVKENEDSNDAIVKRHDKVQKIVSNTEEVINNNNLKKQPKTLKIVDIFNTLEDPIINTISPEKKFIPKEDQEFLKKLSPSLKKKESMLCYFKKLDKDSECSPNNSDNDNLIKVKLKPRNKKRGKKKKLSLNRDIVETCEVLEVIEENNSKDESKANVKDKEKNHKIIEEPIKVSKERVKLANERNKGDIDQNKVQKVLVDETNVHMPETTNFDSASLNGIAIKKFEVNGERHKRKRNSKVDVKDNESEHNTTIFHSETRPKRSVKRPIKYTNDACLSSSDEDLHIFTPKKHKHIASVENDNDKKPVNLKSSQSNYESVKPKCDKKVLKDTVIVKKPAKLAPIFTPKQSDSAALEAKQKFLQSGVPEKLKKIINQQKNNNIADNSFPIVVHVQQDSITFGENDLVIPLLNVSEETVLTYKEGAFKKLLDLTEAVNTYNLDTNYKKGTQIMLQTIKQLHPKFPVYRTYQYFKSRGKGDFKDYNCVDVDNSIEIMNDVADIINDSPDRFNWTDKYRAISTNQIIGNFESIKELRKWLITWTENDMKLKTKSKPGSDSSDYYQSDTDSRDSMKSLNNLLILTGPTGCGKTASVYAVALDLAMKVIEVNASSKRTGKIMLQDLQEATQSHKVNRGTSNTDNSQKSQEMYQTDLSKKNKKRGRPKKLIEGEKTKKKIEKSEVYSGSSMSQESTRTDSSLILIDDADIVFDQDDGFTSAIVQLVQSSKRPVILITSSLVCPHLQRFLQNGKILKMCPLLPRILGTWLDIMCLADSGVCWPGLGAKFLNYFKGDIRKTINYLQFFIPSYMHIVASDEEMVSQNVDLYKNNVDEESSCMSWADGDDTEGRTTAPSMNYKDDTGTNIIWSDFTDKHSNLLNFMYPIDLFNIWWSMPLLLTATSDVNINSGCLKKPKKNTKNICLELEAIANAVDALSLSDFISHKNPDLNRNIASQPWYYSEEHSVSERENSDFYHKEYEVTSELCQSMVASSIATAQDILGCDRKTDLSFPGMILHRQRDRVVSRHKSLTTYLNASGVLDRRALALDYWPSCRTICRFEKSKNNTNTKRNNRFCHYLKSLSVLCKSDTFDNLCDSLNSNEGTELKITSFNE